MAPPPSLPTRLGISIARARGRLRVISDAARGRNGVILQATSAPGLGGSTPIPRVFDFGDFGTGFSNQFYALGAPAPENVEWMFLRSDEWSRVVVRLTSDVWRNGLNIVPTCQKVCSRGHRIKTANVTQCPCGDAQLRDPDPGQREVLEAFAEEADRLEHDPIEKVGRRKTMEGLKHGRSYIVYHFNYEWNDAAPGQNGSSGANGTVKRMSLEQIHVPSSGRFQRWVDKDGRPGGKYMCLRCRNAGRVHVTDEPEVCKQCGGITYEVCYFETPFFQASYVAAAPGIASALMWYAPWEVDETKWPYEDGSAPIARIWAKVAFLLLADWYAAWALDPARDKRPDKILAAIGGSKEGIKDWIKEMNDLLQKEPYSLQVFHIPPPPGGLGEFKADAKVLDLGETNIKGNLPEMRRDFTQAIMAQYHRAPVQGGDVEASGGLNNEGLQRRVASEVVEDLQASESWPKRLAKKLGVTEWTYEFPPAHEEDEGRVADVVLKNLDIAVKARDLGLSVKWEEGEAVIEDGDIEAPMQPPLGGGQLGNPGVAGEEDLLPGTPLEAGGPSEASFRHAPLTAASLGRLHQAAASPLGANSAGLPGDLEALFAGPSGAVAAADAAWQAYEGLTSEQSSRLSDAVVRAMANPRGWNTRSVTEAILPILKDALGDDAAPGRAAIIARMEPRAIASEWLLRLDTAEQVRRGETWLYDWAAPEDHRTTRLSQWLIDETQRRAREAGHSRGLPQEVFLALIDEGIQLAKTGAFTDNGALSSVPGTSIRLPANFRRRGFAAHFGERGHPVKVGVLET